MTLFIQLAEHRNTQALHAKMDELLRAVVDADNETAKIDKQKPKEIEAQRQQNSNEMSPAKGLPIFPAGSPMSRTLIVVGSIIFAIGLLWPWLSRVGLDRLPGDVVIQRENFTFYAPIGTGILISIVLSFVLWLLNR